MHDCRREDRREAGLADAVETVLAGGLVVLPTDTVYGIGANAFDPAAVAALQAAKGRGRSMPPPVLVDRTRTAARLTPGLSDAARALADEFWPGGLTLIVPAAPDLRADLGDTGGTVAVRMPAHPLALDLLRATGPMAVSSANRHGRPPAATAAEAADQLGAAVQVYLEAGAEPGGVPSTIVSLVDTVPRVVRAGAVPAERLAAVVGDLVDEAGNPVRDRVDAPPGDR